MLPLGRRRRPAELRSLKSRIAALEKQNSPTKEQALHIAWKRQHDEYVEELRNAANYMREIEATIPKGWRLVVDHLANEQNRVKAEILRATSRWKAERESWGIEYRSAPSGRVFALREVHRDGIYFTPGADDVERFVRMRDGPGFVVRRPMKLNSPEAVDAVRRFFAEHPDETDVSLRIGASRWQLLDLGLATVLNEARNPQLTR